MLEGIARRTARGSMISCDRCASAERVDQITWKHQIGYVHSTRETHGKHVIVRLEQRRYKAAHVGQRRTKQSVDNQAHQQMDEKRGIGHTPETWQLSWMRSSRR